MRIYIYCIITKFCENNKIQQRLNNKFNIIRQIQDLLLSGEHKKIITAARKDLNNELHNFNSLVFEFFPYPTSCLHF